MSVRQRVSDKQHRWLSLVETTGIVLSEPVLAEAAPAGFRPLDKRKLAEFYKARDIWNLPQGMVEGDPDSRWTDFILEGMLGLKAPAYWQIGAGISPRYVTTLSQQRETLRPTRALIDGENAALLFLRVPRAQSLDTTWTTNGAWKASATTKLERLLRDTGVEVGLLTNGESWRLVVASPSETASWLTWTAQTWADSPSTLAAFIELLGEARFFAGARSGTILELVRASRHRQADVADQLGFQVREALEFFIRELDRIDAERHGAILEGYSLDEIFESGVVFIMRLLFLLKAEETALLPHGSVAYDRSYGVLSLLTRLEETHRLAPEKLDRSREAYQQLLATTRVVHEGSPDPDIHVAEYGGALFDPRRYPLLEGRRIDGTWAIRERPEPLPIRDNIVRDILRCLKYARTGAGVQLVSYRTLEVEHIGHMYEGLLDRRLTRAPVNDPVLLLSGANREAIPELAASELATLKGDPLIKRLSILTDRPEERIRSLLEPPDENTWLPDLGTTDVTLVAIVTPVRRLLRRLGVVRSGGLFVAEGADRRSQGAHYTPSELTEPIVRQTLDPLAYNGPREGRAPAEWTLKTPRELLSLRICDLAMGSGAFLVQVVRYLGARLVESWDAAAAGNRGGASLTLPFAEFSAGDPGELLMPDDHAERVILAERFVVERCIYGVDQNKLAVEMAKLSLWLATVSKDRPFTFLDHALRCGDSLVGVTTGHQIEHFHLDPARGRLLHQTLFNYTEAWGTALAMAVKKRKRIESFPVNSIRDAHEKTRLLHEANIALESVRVLADLIVTPALSTSPKGLAAYDGVIQSLAKKAHDCLHSTSATTSLLSLGATVRAQAPRVRPFHWAIEFPEIFLCGDQSHGGFDAIVGNPPFLGGSRISTTLGSSYLGYLQTHYASQGRADLCCYFFQRAFQLLNTPGTMGLIATNTIAQADSREASLSHIVGNGGTIYSASPSRAWPGRAAVVVSVVHVFKGLYQGARRLRDSSAVEITSFLEEGRHETEPKLLPSQLHRAFHGSVLVGDGFIVPADEAQELIRRNPRNADVLAPYISGKDLNATPDQRPSRWVINFFNWPLSRDSASRSYQGPTAEDYPEILDIVRQRVKPGRDKLADKKDGSAKGYARLWWQYGRRQEGLYSKIRDKASVIVRPRVSNTHAPVFVDTKVVFSDAVVVFVLNSFWQWAILQSSLHEGWARKYCSTLKKDLRYSATDAFENFPFPARATELEAVGRSLYEVRQRALLASNQGLTAFYRRFHTPADNDSELTRIRTLSADLDRSVSSAYGWGDVTLDHAFHETKHGCRYTISEEARSLLLSRLLELNHSRYAEELAAHGQIQPRDVEAPSSPELRLALPTEEDS